MSRYNTQQLQFCMVKSQTIPAEGPQAIPLVLDFSTATPDASGNLSIEIDSQYIQSLGRFSQLQSLFIDMSAANSNLTITLGTSGQKIVAKVNTQGYYNVLAPNPFRLVFTMAPGSTDSLPVYLVNVPIPGVVWATT